MRLRHANAPEGVNGQPEVVAGDVTPAAETPTAVTPDDSGAIATAPETAPAVIPDENFVILKSADNRKLELSIGGTTWNDLEIKVPKEMAVTARRSLLEGGFFLKD